MHTFYENIKMADPILILVLNILNSSLTARSRVFILALTIQNMNQPNMPCMSNDVISIERFEVFWHKTSVQQKKQDQSLQFIKFQS